MAARQAAFVRLTSVLGHSHLRHPRWAAAATLALALQTTACSGTTPGGKSAIDAHRSIPIQELAPITITAFTTMELLAKLEQARALLLEGAYEEAAKDLDRLMRLAEDPQIIALAAHDAGMAYEGLGQRDVAIERYHELVSKYPAEPIAKNALVRLTRIYGHLERWKLLEVSAEQLLEREGLPVMDRIEGLGAMALALVEQDQIDRARIFVAKAQELIDLNGFGRSGAPPVQLAQVAFAEGELRRHESEKILLTPVPPNFGEVLEARCQGLLDAQAAYTEAMRSRDAHWSAMSGFRVGQLYQQLHREAMDIPPPKNVSLKQQQLFEAAMRLRYRILLEKGLKMMDATVRLGDRTGEDSYWVGRARDARAALEQALQDEKAALSKAPYTEDEIRAALDKLKSQVKKATP